jgi:hypothetical protein
VTEAEEQPVPPALRLAQLRSELDRGEAAARRMLPAMWAIVQGGLNPEDELQQATAFACVGALFCRLMIEQLEDATNGRNEQ